MLNAKRDWFVVMTIVVADLMNHTIVVITVSTNQFLSGNHSIFTFSQMLAHCLSTQNNDNLLIIQDVMLITNAMKMKAHVNWIAIVLRDQNVGQIIVLSIISIIVVKLFLLVSNIPKLSRGSCVRLGGLRGDHPPVPPLCPQVILFREIEIVFKDSAAFVFVRKGF